MRAEASSILIAPERISVGRGSRALEAETYIRMKDCGESGPVFECPACGEDAYIDFEGGCALCGEAFEWENCMVCHSQIPREDALAGLDEGICSYRTHIAAKDD